MRSYQQERKAARIAKRMYGSKLPQALYVAVRGLESRADILAKVREFQRDPKPIEAAFGQRKEKHTPVS